MLPYSAAQLCSYDAFKGLPTDKETGELPVKKKLLAGALAGMVSTLATYPLDTLRLRMAGEGRMRRTAVISRAACPRTSE